jgi:hypothetical protein
LTDHPIMTKPQRLPSQPSLMPSDLPPLSDSAAAAVLDFLHEVMFRFEAHYGAQILRIHDQWRDIRSNPPVAPPPDEDDDEPF